MQHVWSVWIVRSNMLDVIRRCWTTLDDVCSNFSSNIVQHFRSRDQKYAIISCPGSGIQLCWMVLDSFEHSSIQHRSNTRPANSPGFAGRLPVFSFFSRPPEISRFFKKNLSVKQSFLDVFFLKLDHQHFAWLVFARYGSKIFCCSLCVESRHESRVFAPVFPRPYPCHKHCGS